MAPASNSSPEGVCPFGKHPIVEKTPIWTRANYVGILEQGVRSYRPEGRVLKVRNSLDMTFDTLVMMLIWLLLLYLDVSKDWKTCFGTYGMGNSTPGMTQAV